MISWCASITEIGAKGWGILDTTNSQHLWIAYQKWLQSSKERLLSAFKVKVIPWKRFSKRHAQSRERMHIDEQISKSVLFASFLNLFETYFRSYYMSGILIQQPWTTKARSFVVWQPAFILNTYKYRVSPWTLDQFENPSGNDVWESYEKRKGRRKDKSAKQAKKADKKEQLNDTMIPSSHLHSNRYRNYENTTWI